MFPIAAHPIGAAPPAASILGLAPEMAVWLVAGLACVALSCMLAALWAGLALRRAATGRRVAGGTAQILVDGCRLRVVTDPAGFLAHVPVLTDTSAFVSLFDASETDVPAHVSRLIDDGRRFDVVARIRGGPLVTLHGQPVGAEARITLDELTVAEQEARTAACRAGAAETARATLAERLDLLPVAVAELDAAGSVSWTNAAFRQLQRDFPTGDGLHRLIAPETADTVALCAGDDGAPHWFRPMRTPRGAHTLITAVDAGAQVTAEQALRRFMRTLGQTFAHLQVGLAVFDQNQRLSLFNPALATLFGLDAASLATQPSLRDFLEALRHRRKVPDKLNFARWRDQLTRLSAPGSDGAYQEDWTLSDDQTISVTGRHHGQGALVFLFEDISDRIQIERRYRREIEMSQATLDHLAEGVAVFDTAGALIFANTAFERMWAIDGMSTLEAPDITQICRACAIQCGEDPLWDRLRVFVQGGGARAAWCAAITLPDGGTRICQFSLLPDGSAMTAFSDAPASSPQTPLRSVIAQFLAGTGLAAGAVPHLDRAAPLIAGAWGGAGRPATQGPAAQGISGDDHMDTLLAICGFLETTGQTLRIADWTLCDRIGARVRLQRRLLWCLGLTAAHLADQGSIVTLSGSATAGGASIAMTFRPTADTAQGAVAAASTAPDGMDLLERTAAAVGARLRVDRTAAPHRCTISCDISGATLDAADAHHDPEGAGAHHSTAGAGVHHGPAGAAALETKTLKIVS